MNDKLKKINKSNREIVDMIFDEKSIKQLKDILDLERKCERIDKILDGRDEIFLNRNVKDFLTVQRQVVLLTIQKTIIDCSGMLDGNFLELDDDKKKDFIYPDSVWKDY